MARVLVLAGGSSDEREVSLRSGAAVAKALHDTGHEVVQIDPVDGPLAATLQGIDVVFPVLHGAGGEDGSIQAELEKLGVPYVGSGVKASQLCFDKWRWREAMQTAGLPLADGALVNSKTYENHELASKPHVLKPVRGGSSIDTFIVRGALATPKTQMAKALEKYSEMLLEQLIVGTELTVGVLGEQALPVIEIIPPELGEFDYENKYNAKSQELCPPKNVGEKIQKASQELAFTAHQLAGCRDFSRTDIMCDQSGKLYLLETNTIPGMTDQSLFPKMARTAGLSMSELCEQLVQMALSR